MRFWKIHNDEAPMLDGYMWVHTAGQRRTIVNSAASRMKITRQQGNIQPIRERSDDDEKEDSKSGSEEGKIGSFAHIRIVTVWRHWTC